MLQGIGMGKGRIRKRVWSVAMEVADWGETAYIYQILERPNWVCFSGGAPLLLLPAARWFCSIFQNDH
jgi:hypothetical protein